MTIDTRAIKARIIEIADAVANVRALYQQPENLNGTNEVIAFVNYSTMTRTRRRDFRRVDYEVVYDVTFAVDHEVTLHYYDQDEDLLLDAVSAFIASIESRPHLEHPTTSAPLASVIVGDDGDGARVTDAPITINDAYNAVSVTMSLTVPVRSSAC